MTDAHHIPAHSQRGLPMLPLGLTLLLTSRQSHEDERDLVEEIVAAYQAAPHNIHVLVAEPVILSRRPGTAFGLGTPLSGGSDVGSDVFPPVLTRGPGATHSSPSSPTEITGRHFEASGGLAHVASLPGRNLVVWDEAIWRLRSRDYERAAAILRPLNVPGQARGLMHSIRPTPDAHLSYQQFHRL